MSEANNPNQPAAAPVLMPPVKTTQAIKEASDLANQLVDTYNSLVEQIKPLQGRIEEARVAKWNTVAAAFGYRDAEEASQKGFMFWYHEDIDSYEVISLSEGRRRQRIEALEEELKELKAAEPAKN